MDMKVEAAYFLLIGEVKAEFPDEILLFRV